MQDSVTPSLKALKEYPSMSFSNEVPSLFTDNIVPSATSLNAIFTNTQTLTPGYSLGPGWLMYVTVSQLITAPDQDILPLLLTVDLPMPHNITFSDIYSPSSVPSNSGFLMGVLGLTYP